MHGRGLALAMAVVVVALPAAAMAQAGDRPLDPDFMFHRPSPVDLPWQHSPQQLPWPPPAPELLPYGPPPPESEPDHRRQSTDTRAMQLPCSSRPDRLIPDSGFNAYMEHRALQKGQTDEAAWRGRDHSVWPGYCDTRKR